VVLLKRGERVYAHRVIFRWGDRWWTKGDARWAWDRPAARTMDLLGVAAALVPDDGRAVSHRGIALLELLRALAAWPFLGIIRRRRADRRPSGKA
jgi:hypothetical protein